MQRRTFLRAGGATLAGATAGCFGLLESEPGGEPPVLDDRPNAAYIPTHVEGMEMADMVSAGRYQFALSYSFPHRFWQITGSERRRVEIQDQDSIHLMLSVWDDETGTVLPSSDIPITVSRDGETVESRTMWLMLSQNMGVHFGDNVPLEGDGTYEVALDYGPVPARLLGEFHDTLGESASVTLDLEFDSDDLENLMFERLDDRAGERDALQPMEMDMMPTAQLPPAEDLPGEHVGTAELGDGVFAGTTLDETPVGIDESGTYLAVSARTPYNRYPIPRTSVSASVPGNSDSEEPLEATIHPDMGFHYGAVVDEIDSDVNLELSVTSPSSISRHEGYETAFMETGSVTLTE